MISKVLRKPQFRCGVLVLVPVLLWYLLFSFRPIALSLKMALTDYKLLDPGNSPWVGLKHFSTLLFDYSLFWTAAKNTAVYAVIITLSTMLLSLVLAWALASVVRGRGFFQGAIFLPVVISMAAIALMFRHLMDPSGILNHLLKMAGFPPWKWLVGVDSAMPSIAIVSIWKSLGRSVVIMLAGILAIPEKIYESAKIDGAGVIQQFWYITMPLLAPTLKLVLILVTIGSLQAYVSVILLTDGGPANATLMLNQFIVEEAFGNFRLSLASAASFILFSVILFITVFQLNLMRSDWEY